MERIKSIFLGVVAGLSLIALAGLTADVFAQEEVPTYSGDFWSRSTLTGDWGGARNDLAKKGVTLDLNLTQIVQGDIGGGKKIGWEYGGRGDPMIVGPLPAQIKAIEGVTAVTSQAREVIDNDSKHPKLRTTGKATCRHS